MGTIMEVDIMEVDIKRHLVIKEYISEEGNSPPFLFQNNSTVKKLQLLEITIEWTLSF